MICISELQVLLVGAEPGSGGCLDALNPRVSRGFPEGFPRQDRRNAASQTLLHMVDLFASLVRHSLHSRF
jgi:hypothetical protein